MIKLQSCESMGDESGVYGVKLIFENTNSANIFFQRFINNFTRDCIVIDNERLTIKERSGNELRDYKEFDLTEFLSSDELEALKGLFQENSEHLLWNCDQSGQNATLMGRHPNKM